MEIELVHFLSNTLKVSETCQKLTFTHPIVVLKSGLKNNWMKKLDRVNRHLGPVHMIPGQLIAPGQLTDPGVISASVHGLTSVTVHMSFSLPWGNFEYNTG